MRRSLGKSAKRVYEHVTFMANRRLLSYSIAVMLANILTIVFMLFIGPPTQMQERLSYPLIFSTIIYKTLMALQASRISREINNGEAQLYLAHTLTRAEYLISAFLVVGATPTLLLIITYTMLVAIAAPNLLANSNIGLQLLYIFVDFMIYTAIILGLASKGYENAVSVVGIILALLLWAFMAMLISVYVNAGYSLLKGLLLYLVYGSLLISACITPFTYYIYYSVYPIQSNPYPISHQF